jgi:protein-S-isoprenylcysteine O-methyltransferase Ste14
MSAHPDGLRGLGIDDVVFLAATLILVGNVLRRPAPVDVDRRPWVVALCIASTIYVFGYQWGSSNTESLGGLFVWPILAVHWLGDVCLIYLGKAFAILPARREIKTSFVYRFVRHPIYSLYITADAVFLATTLTPQNLFVFTVGCAFFVARALIEERVLARDPVYRAYQLATSYRFFPGIF